MKKISILLISFLIISGLFAQESEKSEFRYSAIKFSIIHGYSLQPPANDNVLLKTPLGDMLKTNPTLAINYVPGFAFSWNYHFDAKSNKLGFVTGLEVQNNGFQSKYKTESGTYSVVDRYRVLSVGVPFYAKFGVKNIFRNQTYIIFGLQYNYYAYTQNIQKANANWSAERYSSLMSGEQRRKSGLAVLLGFNYNIFNIQLEFWPMSPVNNKYLTQVEGAQISPYSHIDFKTGFYLKTGINVPLSRWLTTRNWRAEQIRRRLKGAK